MRLSAQNALLLLLLCVIYVDYVAASYPGPRTIREPFVLGFGRLSHLLSDGVLISADQHRSALRSFHTDAVDAAIAELEPSRVCNQLSPSISESESLLPFPARVALSHLRSGLCLSLMDFRTRIGATDNFLFPNYRL